MRIIGVSYKIVGFHRELQGYPLKSLEFIENYGVCDDSRRNFLEHSAASYVAERKSLENYSVCDGSRRNFLEHSAVFVCWMTLLVAPAGGT